MTSPQVFDWKGDATKGKGNLQELDEKNLESKTLKGMSRARSGQLQRDLRQRYAQRTNREVEEGNDK